MRFSFGILAAALSFSLMGTAHADKFPDRAVTLVVPFNPGGSSDQVARPLAKELARIWNVPVVVTNRAGAGGAVGMAGVARARPDGYTIMLTNPSFNLLPITNQLFDRESQSSQADFVTLGRVSAEPLLMVANTKAPWNSFPDFAKDAAKTEGALTYASSGPYGASHVPTEMLASGANIKLTHVPYSGGGGPSVTAVLAGEVDLTGTSPSALMPMINNGNLKPLVQMGRTRHPLLPNTPTAIELGYGAEFYIWAGLFTSVKVPADIVQALRDGVKAATNSPEFKESMQALGIQIDYLDGPAFAPFLDKEAVDNTHRKCNPMSIQHAVNIEDFRRLAKRRLPKIAFDYIDGGVDDEHGEQTNKQGFLKHRLQPRYLVDVSRRDPSTTLLGRHYSLPFGFSPMGTMGLFRPGGEAILAQAAVEANIPYVMSGAGNALIEDIVKIAPQHMWYQLYAAENRDISNDQLKRAWDAGVEVLVVTLDVPVRTRRERNIRNGFSISHRLKPSIMLEALTHPAWIVDYLRHGGAPTLENWKKYAPPGANAMEIANFFNSQVPASSQTWDDLANYRGRWQRKLVVKGIMHPDDAVRAADLGVDGILVSNHGGRQLDRARATIDAFPAIHAAVGDRVELMLDSGVRRGTDIITALCLGARYVFLGRAALYAVAAGGQPGINKAIDILRSELDLNMGQLGCPDIASLGREVLYPA